ncbi:hypothetical protein S40285_00569 [Stachybotrys chlorohalonatus IBT 40285]|uniref:Adenylate kinase n=1 Tax=Stachybotrys chlorohalonatus (strain IBT 40285) TaxID=1283841 RepID=A0A084R2T1_STAC4|nr:hypothetical protein S40285_00569 [Stachybotrys chlorohalonata IBT 40285]
MIFVIGPPGSGKGTLCSLVEGTQNWSGSAHRHLSVGDYLRTLCGQERPPESLLYNCDAIRTYIQHNKVIPGDLLVPIVQHKMTVTPNGFDADTMWLIDGLPHSLEQALAFDGLLGMPIKVIILECDPEIAKARFLLRGREPADDEERFYRRYDNYLQNLREIHQHYGKITKIIRVNGSREECLDAFLGALWEGQ